MLIRNENREDFKEFMDIVVSERWNENKLRLELLRNSNVERKKGYFFPIIITYKRHIFKKKEAKIVNQVIEIKKEKKET